MIGILCPSTFEYNVLDRKRLKQEGCALICSGMGKVRSATGCFKLLKANPKLRFVLLIGFAGGLTRDLKIGDVIEPRLFIEQDYNAEPLEKFPNSLRSKKSKRLCAKSKNATMLTQDRFLKNNPYADSPEAKKFGTLACDMESYAAAYACQELGLGFGVIKLISDVANENAEHDFLKSCQALSPKLDRVVLDAVRSLALGIVFSIIPLFLGLGPVQAEEDNFDSQPYTETPSFNNKFKEAPGMAFDVPEDMQVTNVNNSIQVETPTHYMFRKVKIQDQQIAEFKNQLKAMSDRLATVEAKVAPSSGEQKPIKKLSSFEQQPEPVAPPAPETTAAVPAEQAQLS